MRLLNDNEKGSIKRLIAIKKGNIIYLNTLFVSTTSSV